MTPKQIEVFNHLVEMLESSLKRSTEERATGTNVGVDESVSSGRVQYNRGKVEVDLLQKIGAMIAKSDQKEDSAYIATHKRLLSTYTELYGDEFASKTTATPKNSLDNRAYTEYDFNNSVSEYNQLKEKYNSTKPADKLGEKSLLTLMENLVKQLDNQSTIMRKSRMWDEKNQKVRASIVPATQLEKKIDELIRNHRSFEDAIYKSIANKGPSLHVPKGDRITPFNDGGIEGSDLVAKEKVEHSKPKNR